MLLRGLGYEPFTPMLFPVVQKRETQRDGWVY